MGLILDSWKALAQHTGLTAAVLACLGWGSLIVLAGLRGAAGSHLSRGEYFALALAGWPLPLLPVCLAVFVLSRLAPAPAVWLSLLMAVTAGPAAFVVMRMNPAARPRAKSPKRERWGGAAASFTALIVIFILLLFLRLGFIAGTLLPQYIDSAEHTRLSGELIAQIRPGTMRPGPLNWPAPTYYHLGFHLLTAVLSAALGFAPQTVILVLGQVVLACIPIPFFFIVRRVSGSGLAGLFAVILAGFGWYMPAHGVDWGKYPALTSLLTIQFSIYTAWLLHTKSAPPCNRRILWTLFIGSVIITFFIHTRSVIVTALLIAAWAAAGRWLTLPRRWRRTAAGILIGLSLVMIQRAWSGDGRLALDPYFGNGLPITGLVLLMFPLAVKAAPRAAVAGLLSMMFIFGCMFVPVRGVFPGFGELNLLDRPLVEMSLFMPLAWTGGLGSAGLLQALQQMKRPWPGSVVGTHANRRTARAAVVLGLAGIVVVHSLAKYSYRPSDCCRIAGLDDIAALDVIATTLPSDGAIAIAAAELNVRSYYDDAPVYAGADAGIWIASLTGRPTIPFARALEFDKEDALHQLCARDVDYIYRGGTPQSFDASTLDRRPDWYRSLFYLPGAQIYEITGCP
jgi:hypothetical protein